MINKSHIPSGHKEILTEDGSLTLFSEAFNETCHSTSGAVSETILHYLKGCEIEEKIKIRNELNILEVGFGTGIGFLETYKLSQNYPCKVNFTSLEIDENLIIYFFEKNKLNYTKEENFYAYKNDQISLSIFYGNARSSIKKITKKFDAIYQDAFSPKKNAELWTTEWFITLKEKAYDDCLMSTYSSSSSIRKSMISAGWKLYKGEKFGPKRSSTRARLNGTTEIDILEQLQRSPAVEITDENFKAYQEGKLS